MSLWIRVRNLYLSQLSLSLYFLRYDPRVCISLKRCQTNRFTSIIHIALLPGVFERARCNGMSITQSWEDYGIETPGGKAQCQSALHFVPVSTESVTRDVVFAAFPRKVSLCPRRRRRWVKRERGTHRRHFLCEPLTFHGWTTGHLSRRHGILFVLTPTPTLSRSRTHLRLPARLLFSPPFPHVRPRARDHTNKSNGSVRYPYYFFAHRYWRTLLPTVVAVMANELCWLRSRSCRGCEAWSPFRDIRRVSRQGFRRTSRRREVLVRTRLPRVAIEVACATERSVNITSV